MTASDARLHLRYSAWASQRLLDSAASLDPDKLDLDLKTSHLSILRTLAHIQFADWIWYTRTVEPIERPGDTLEVLMHSWPELYRKWIALADSLTDADMERFIEYQALDGSSHRSKIWQIILHIVNHGTLHRGQVMAMFRQVGVKPPGTDLIYYYRELENAGNC